MSRNTIPSVRVAFSRRFRAITCDVIALLLVAQFFAVCMPMRVSAAVTQADVPFTYTGNWDITRYETGEFYARFLTSGTFTPKEDIQIDVFLVGGGGAGGTGVEWSEYGSGGGGGGYTASFYNQSVIEDQPISVIIGEGGKATQFVVNTGGTGGQTEFGHLVVNGV